MGKPDVGPQRQKFCTQIDQHNVEVVRAHMGLGVNENVLRRAAGGQLLQNEAVAGVPGAGVELSVGKGAGAPLSKLHVGPGIQHAGAPEVLHIRRSMLHASSPFQHNGPQTRPGQHQSGEQPRRPAPTTTGAVSGAGGADGKTYPGERSSRETFLLRQRRSTAASSFTDTATV